LQIFTKFRRFSI